MTKKRKLGSTSYETSNFPIENIPNGLINDEVQCTPKRVPETPPHLPKLPIMIGAIGTCGRGKTNAGVNYINENIAHGSFTETYIFSPTYDSNSSLQQIPVKPENVYKNMNTCMADIMDVETKIIKLKQDYDFEKKYKKAYLKFIKNGSLNQLKHDEVSMLVLENYRLPMDLPWPSPVIFIDDMVNTAIMKDGKDNAFVNLCLRHRHVGQIGVSIFGCFQTFKNGLPKPIRKNLSGIITFGTCNTDEIKEIWTECASHVSYPTFKNIFAEATDGKHDFLFINKNESDLSRQFWINFDKRFIVNINEEKRKALNDI